MTTSFAADQPKAEAEKAAKDSGGPHIVFDETKHNFGMIEPQKLTCTFKFKNAGDATLEIKNVQPGCGCTVVPDYDKKVEPGKEGKISVVVNAGTFKGHIEKGLTVSSNDPKTPNVHLAVAADIKVELSVHPQPNIWFNRLMADSVTNQSVEIKSMMSEPLVVESVDSSVDWLTASVESSTTNSAKITVTTKPPLPTGMQVAKITAHTKYAKYSNVVINVTAQVPATISVIPPRIVFLKNQGKGAFDISVLVMRNDGKDFHIKDVDTKSTLINSMVTTNTAGRSYRVNLSYLPKGSQKPTDGTVEIVTDEPKFPKLEVPYVFR